MKTKNVLILFLLSMVVAFSCSSNDEDLTPPVEQDCGVYLVLYSDCECEFGTVGCVTVITIKMSENERLRQLKDSAGEECIEVTAKMMFSDSTVTGYIRHLNTDCVKFGPIGPPI